MENEFSVYQWFPDGQYEKVVEFVSAENAMHKAIFCSSSVGAKIGTTRRVIITDGGDCTVWEWLHGEGVIWPKQS